MLIFARGKSITKLVISMQGIRRCLSMRRPLGTLIKEALVKNCDVHTLFNDEKKNDKIFNDEKKNDNISSDDKKNDKLAVNTDTNLT